MMTLAAYLKKTKQSFRTFAAVSGISPATLCRVTQGRRPSIDVAFLIEKKTGGKVTAASMSRVKPRRQIVRAAAKTQEG